MTKYPTLLCEPDEPLPFIQMGEYVLALELGELSEFGHEIARKELRETDDVKEQAIRELREMLRDEEKNGLIVPLENDYWLIRFLRPCKFYPKSTFQLIQSYYKYKVKHSKIYDDLLPSKEAKILSQSMLTVFPKRDQHGRRIFVMELGRRWNHKEVTIDEVFKGSVLFLEAALTEPETQVHGIVIMFDLDGFSLQQALKVTPSVASRLVELLQEALPLRLKALHIVNENQFFSIAFKVVKLFLQKKLNSRIYFHGTNMNSLHKHVTPDCLPTQYGGVLDLPRVPGEDWCRLLQQCDKECVAINSFGYKRRNGV